MMAAQGIDMDRSIVPGRDGQAAALPAAIVSHIREDDLDAGKSPADDTPVGMWWGAGPCRRDCGASPDISKR